MPDMIITAVVSIVVALVPAYFAHRAALKKQAQTAASDLAQAELLTAQATYTTTDAHRVTIESVLNVVRSLADQLEDARVQSTETQRELIAARAKIDDLESRMKALSGTIRTLTFQLQALNVEPNVEWNV